MNEAALRLCTILSEELLILGFMLYKLVHSYLSIPFPAPT